MGHYSPWESWPLPLFLPLPPDSPKPSVTENTSAHYFTVLGYFKILNSLSVLSVYREPLLDPPQQMPPHTGTPRMPRQHVRLLEVFRAGAGVLWEEGASVPGIVRWTAAISRPPVHSFIPSPPPQGLLLSSAPPRVCFVDGVPYPITSKICLAPIVVFCSR